MGISNQNTKVVVQGNGAQVTFSYGFLIPINGAYLLIYTDESGTNYVQPLSAYTVTGLGNPNGGTFTFSLGGTPIPVNTTLTFARMDGYTQDVNFDNQNSYLPEVLTTALNAVVLQTQQLAENVSRCIQVPINETYSPVLPTAPLRSNGGSGTVLGFAAVGGVLQLYPPGGGGGGGTITLPSNAPFLGTDGSGVAFAGVLGAGLTETGGTLSATAAALPANAALLGTDSGSNAQAVVLGAGLTLGSGTLSATGNTIPVNAAVLASNSGGTITALALGAGLASSGGTLSATAAAVPTSASLLNSNSGGTLKAVTLGSNLHISAAVGVGGGILSLATNASWALMATSSTNALVPVVLGSGISITGQTPSSGGTINVSANVLPPTSPLLGADNLSNPVRVNLGAGLSLIGGTLSATAAGAPANAALLGSNSTSTLTAVTLGAGLALSAGTLSASAASFPANAAVLASVSGTIVGLTLGSGLTSSGGTLNSTVTPPAAGLVSSTGSSFIDTTIGTGLSLSAGTLSSLLSPPVSAALLGSNSGGTLTPVVLGSGLVLTSGTLTAAALSLPGAGLVSTDGTILEATTLGANLAWSAGTLTAASPASAALLASNSGGTNTAIVLGTNLSISSGTLNASAAAWEITDGTHTVTNVTTLSTNGTVSGSGGHATLTVGGGGSGNVTLGDPTNGVTLIGRDSYNRPALGSTTLVRAQTSSSGTLGYMQDYNTAGLATGPITIQTMGNDATLRGASIAHGQSGTFSITGQIQMDVLNSNPTAGDGYYTGIGLYETSSGKALLLDLLVDGLGSSYPEGFAVKEYDNTGNDAGTIYIRSQNLAQGSLFLKIQWDPTGPVINAFMSVNGLVWQPLTLNANASGIFTGAPDQMFFGLFGGNTNQLSAAYCWQLFASTP